MHVAETQFVELGQAAAVLHAFGLVHRQQAGLAQAPQFVGDVVVLGREALPAVEHEDDDVGLGHGLARLLGHLAVDAAAGVGLEAAGVDDDEFARPDVPGAVVAVTRQAGEVGHDRVTRLREAVEQGRLAHVRAADQGDDGFHGLTVSRGRAQRGRQKKDAAGRRRLEGRICSRRGRKMRRRSRRTGPIRGGSRRPRRCGSRSPRCWRPAPAQRRWPSHRVPGG